MKEINIPFSLPEIGEEEINEVVDTLRSGWLTTGKKAARFEHDLAKYAHARSAVVVSSCTAAMHIALKALDIGPGDEVITTPFTFISTVEAIIHVGATPVLVDIQDDTMNIDPEKIQEKITKRTRAILPVHYAGHPCDMDEIFALAKEYNLKVIEDAAHAIGARYKGVLIGGLKSDATCYSFYATKNLTTGEGGALLTNNEDIARRARLLSLHGITKDAWARYGDGADWRYDLGDIGFKYNLTDIQASIGIHQLKKLDQMNKARKALVALYDQEFCAVNGVRVPQARTYVDPAYHLYPLRVSRRRDALIAELRKHNIGASVHFIPACTFSIMKERFGFKEDDYPVTMQAFSEVISLPLYSHLNPESLRYVAATVKGILKEL
jgi:dTDP-4-amino-4,6-dideoxygalactose transaminase